MTTITPTSARGSPAKKIKDSNKAYSTHAPDETGHACFFCASDREAAGINPSAPTLPVYPYFKRTDIRKNRIPGLGKEIRNGYSKTKPVRIS